MRFVFFICTMFSFFSNIVFAQAGQDSFTLQYDVPSHGWKAEAENSDPVYIFGGLGTTHLRFFSDGNLVLSDANSNKLWESFTSVSGRKDRSAEFNRDLVECYDSTRLKSIKRFAAEKFLTVDKNCNPGSLLMLTYEGLSILDYQGNVIWKTDLVYGVPGDITLKVKDEALVLCDDGNERDIWSSSAGYIHGAQKTVSALHSSYGTSALADSFSTLEAGDRMVGRKRERGSRNNGVTEWLELFMDPNGELAIYKMGVGASRSKGTAPFKDKIWSSGTAISGVAEGDADWGATRLHVTPSGLELRRSNSVVWRRGNVIDGKEAKNLNFALSFRDVEYGDISGAIDTLVLMAMDSKTVTYKVYYDSVTRDVEELISNDKLTCSDSRYDDGKWLLNTFVDLGYTFANDIEEQALCDLVDRYSGSPVMFFKVGGHEAFLGSELDEYIAADELETEVTHAWSASKTLWAKVGDPGSVIGGEPIGSYTYHEIAHFLAPGVTGLIHKEEDDDYLFRLAEAELTQTIKNIIYATEAAILSITLLDKEKALQFAIDSELFETPDKESQLYEIFFEPVEAIISTLTAVEDYNHESNDGGNSRRVKSDNTVANCLAICVFQSREFNPARVNVGAGLNFTLSSKMRDIQAISDVKNRQGVRLFFRMAWTTPELLDGRLNAALRFRVVNPVDFLNLIMDDHALLSLPVSLISVAELVIGFDWPANQQIFSSDDINISRVLNRTYGGNASLIFRSGAVLRNLLGRLYNGLSLSQPSAAVPVPNGRSLSGKVRTVDNDLKDRIDDIWEKESNTLLTIDKIIALCTAIDCALVIDFLTAVCEVKCPGADEVNEFARALVSSSEDFSKYLGGKLRDNIPVLQKFASTFENSTPEGRSIFFHAVDSLGALTHQTVHVRTQITGVQPTVQTVGDDLHTFVLSHMMDVNPNRDEIKFAGSNGVTIGGVDLKPHEVKISDLSPCEQKVYVDNFDDQETVVEFMHRVEQQMDPLNGICGDSGDGLQRRVSGQKYWDDVDTGSAAYKWSVAEAIIRAVLVSVLSEGSSFEGGTGFGLYFSYDLDALGKYSPIEVILPDVLFSPAITAGLLAVTGVELTGESLNPEVSVNSLHTLVRLTIDAILVGINEAVCASKNVNYTCHEVLDVGVYTSVYMSGDLPLIFDGIPTQSRIPYPEGWLVDSAPLQYNVSTYWDMVFPDYIPFVGEQLRSDRATAPHPR